MTAGGVLHPCGDIKTADRHTVMLVFYRAGTYGNIGEKVCEIPPVFGVEHLVSGSQAGLFDVADMKLSDGDKTF